ncbi:MAG: hypothetical protein FJX76_02840 [Armatimonadetes bacterium]|nr:hypothetical protein [Armatimonadota bacterium]
MRKLGVVAAVVGLVVAVAAGVVVWKMRGKVFLNPAEVEGLAARMLPGARPPAGMKAVLGLHPEELEVAIFAPSIDRAEPANLSGGDIRILIARPERREKAPSASEIRERIGKARERKQEEMDTVSESPTLLRVGGMPYPGMKSTVVLKSNGSRMTEYMSIFVRDKAPTVLLILGPEASFNQAAMQQFLDGLEAPAAPMAEGGNGKRLPDLPRLPHAPPGP